MMKKDFLPNLDPKIKRFRLIRKSSFMRDLMINGSLCLVDLMKEANEQFDFVCSEG